VYKRLKLSKYCVEKTLEICAVQLETMGKQLIIICIYRAPSRNFNWCLKLFDIVLQSLYDHMVEFLVCGDINVDYLTNCNRQQHVLYSEFPYKIPN
jgi:hypothetical protein